MVIKILSKVKREREIIEYIYIVNIKEEGLNSYRFRFLCLLILSMLLSIRKGHTFWISRFLPSSQLPPHSFHVVLCLHTYSFALTGCYSPASALINMHPRDG